MSNYTLSKGALRSIMQGKEIDDPVIQIMATKAVSSGQVNKCRLMVSDGIYKFNSVLLTTKDSRQPTVFTIIKIKNKVVSVVSSTKRILLILDYEIVAEGGDIGTIIGKPETLTEEMTKADSGNDNPRASTTSKSHNENSMATTSSSYQPVSTNGHSLSDAMTCPITALTPYQQKWVIKARVMSKSPIRTWSNSKGEGKLFSVDFLDDSGEIRATGFREMVDKYYEFLQVDKIYYLSKCQIKLANKQFSTLKNDYEMTFGNETIIQECNESEADAGVPKVKFNFVPIDQIANLETGAIIDVIGICKQSGDVQTIITKSTNKELRKRELMMVDSTKTMITVTLWGSEAENYDYDTPVIAFKGVRVNEFNGSKTLSTPGSCVIKFNPDITEAYDLRSWYDNGGKQEDISNISARTGSTGNFQSRWLSFQEAKQLNLGNGDGRSETYQTKGTVMLIRSNNCFYKACPQENCNKKIIDLQNGQYRCEKCNSEYPNFKYRLLGSINVSDWSDNQWMSAFSTEMEKILGKTADEIGNVASQDEDMLQEIINEGNFKQFIFKCRTKVESYNDESRLKTIVTSVEPINYKEYNAYLISQIQKLTGVKL